jgi:hypothetical protein
MTSDYFEKLDKKLITLKKELITDKGTYILYLIENKNLDMLELFFGGTQGGCLIIFIENTKSDIALLDSLKYDSKCNLENDLKESSGTKHLINTAFSYVKKHYPNIKYVTFSDRSTKDCKTKLQNGSIPSMNLGLTHLLLKKTTWYESILGAYIIDEHIRTEYNEFVKTIETIPINMSFDKFDFKYLKYDRQLFLKLNKKYNLDLPNLFTKHKYYYTLFKELREKITDDIDSCLFFGAIIYKLMTDISNDKTRLFLSASWMFNLKNIDNVEFTDKSFLNDLVGGMSVLFFSIQNVYDTHLNNINSLELF